MRKIKGFKERIIKAEDIDQEELDIIRKFAVYHKELSEDEPITPSEK